LFPKRKDLFDAWHKAMVAGATVDKPNYGKTNPSRGIIGTHKSGRKRRKKRRRKNNAKKT